MKKIVTPMLVLAVLVVAAVMAIGNSTDQTLPFTQNWTNTALISANNDWSAVPGIRGLLGDITGTKQVVWSRTRGAPYVPSPVLYGDSLYTLQHYQGIISRLDVKTGENQGGPFRLACARCDR